MKKSYILIIVILLFFNASAYAVTFDVQDIRLGINGYVDLEYTYMTRAPEIMTSGDIGRMDIMSSLNQHHMNLLFDAEKEKYRVHINISSVNSYSTHEGEHDLGDFEIQEAYGEYLFNEHLKIKLGNFLAPSGIYNEIRYITPLFATVVLPQLYEPPSFYSGESILPDHGNAMLRGRFLGETYDIDYSVYIATGERNEKGFDINRDKGVGIRLKTTILEDYRVGVTYFTIRNDRDEGRESTYAGDIALDLMDSILLEGEFAFDHHNNKKDKMAYYVRMIYNMGDFSPFVAYDHFIDYEDAVFRNGMNRFGIGSGYSFSENIAYKIEYHYHKFNQNSGLVEDTDRIHMFTAAAIFTF